jgi:2-hydroxyglutarate dehydrogenase
MQPFEFCVVGGGIVGLAVACRLAQFGSTIVLEKNARVIEETSGRNSGVVHAGIYYPPRSLKTQLCIDGNQKMWNLLNAFPEKISARKIGKWIGAFDESQVPQLETIEHNMKSIGVPVRRLAQEEMRSKEPNVRLNTAIESPNTGIVDVTSLADFFIAAIEGSSTDSLVAVRSLVSKIQQDRSSDAKSLKVTVASRDGGEEDVISCRRVIMSAGLHSSNFWRGGGFRFSDGSAIPFDPSVETHYCKGRYIGYRDSSILSRLVYPCPQPNLKSLGVHSIVDLAGGVRFGPDAHYVNDLDISVSDDPVFVDQMFEAIRAFVPNVRKDKMFVDFAGIRPKLSNEGEPFRDFHIQPLHADAQEITLLAGIESPGLTACMSIADYVAERVVDSGVLRNISAPWHR